MIVTALNETLGFGIGEFANYRLRAQRPAESSVFIRDAPIGVLLVAGDRVRQGDLQAKLQVALKLYNGIFALYDSN